MQKLKNICNQFQNGKGKVEEQLSINIQQKKRNESELEFSLEEFTNNIEKFRYLVEHAQNLKDDGVNQKIVFLIGNTRAGKSTLFHLLQGHDLIINEQENFDVKEQAPSYIGHGRMAFTKHLNSFQNNNKIVFIDTPGLHDTDDGYQEIVSQLNLQRQMNKFQNVYILIVAYYDTRSNNELQDTLRITQQLFNNKNHFDKLKDKIRLVITQSGKTKNNMVVQMEKFFSEITEENPQYMGREILEHFQQNSSKILFFKKNANSEEQTQLRKEIEQFIEQIEHQQPGQSDQVQNQQQLYYQLIISDKGKIKIQQFLIQLISFYQDRLTSVFDKINQQLNNNNELDQNFIICQQIYNLLERLDLNNVFQFQTELYKILQDEKFSQCINKILNQANFLFTQDYVKIMLQIQEKNYNSEIKIGRAFKKFQEIALQVAQQFQQLQVDKSKEWIQYFNSMFELYQNFVKLKDWKKIVVIIGNRLSGKSKALNLLYKQKVFTENQLEKQSGIIKNQIYQDFVSFKVINQDVVVEIKELSFELLPFIEFFFKTAIDRKSLFLIVLVLNGSEQPEDKVFQALNRFLGSNSFENLKIINNYQTENPLIEDELIKLIPCLNKQKFDMKNSCCQIVRNQENFEIQNLEIFNNEKLRQIKIYNKKHQLIGFDWWFQYFNLYFIGFQKNIFKNDFCLWAHSKLPYITNLIFLSELDPTDDEDKFKIKLKKIYQIYNQKMNEVKGKNYQLLQFLLQFLINNQIEQQIQSSIKEVTETKNQLEQLIKNFDGFLEPVYYIIPMAKTISFIKQFFPTSLEEISQEDEQSYQNKNSQEDGKSQLNEKLDEKLECIQIIVNDIFQFDKENNPILQKQPTEDFVAYNVALILRKEIDNVLQCLTNLQKLIEESQDPDFVLNDEWFITRWPKKLYRRVKRVFQNREKEGDIILKKH